MEQMNKDHYEPNMLSRYSLWSFDVPISDIKRGFTYMYIYLPIVTL